MKNSIFCLMVIFLFFSCKKEKPLVTEKWDKIVSTEVWNIDAIRYTELNAVYYPDCEDSLLTTEGTLIFKDTAFLLIHATSGNTYETAFDNKMMKILCPVVLPGQDAPDHFSMLFATQMKEDLGYDTWDCATWVPFGSSNPGNGEYVIYDSSWDIQYDIHYSRIDKDRYNLKLVSITPSGSAEHQKWFNIEISR